MQQLNELKVEYTNEQFNILEFNIWEWCCSKKNIPNTAVICCIRKGFFLAK